MVLSIYNFGVHFVALLAIFSGICAAQQSASPTNPATTDLATTDLATTDPGQPSQKRIFGFIPNYRTYPLQAEYKPLTASEKFKIAINDSFDRGTFVMAAAFAGEGQLSKSQPAFGQGVAGYSRYLGTAYGDLMIGDFMTEAVYPTILHQDPRYFRKGEGSGIARLGYAIGQIFWTHKDSGGMEFNYSEIVGNSTAVAISTAYYPAGRDWGSAVSKLGTQVGVDMAGNVLKEFWPDLQKKLSRKHKVTLFSDPAMNQTR